MKVPTAVKTEAVCVVLLAHLSPEKTAALIQRWRRYLSPESEIVLGYGGPAESFPGITHEPKIFIEDARLRTRDHQREKQSYTEVFQKVTAWLESHPAYAHVYLAEFDQWPLVEDVGRRLIEQAEREDADVLGHELYRRDQTCCAYYQYHMSEPGFVPWLEQVSRREDRGVVLNMLGTGSFWTREAFMAVGKRAEPFPMYLELYLPTLAHHLGFRLRDFGDQNRFISAKGDRYDEIDEARRQGAWTIHPVKTWPGDLPQK